MLRDIQRVLSPPPPGAAWSRRTMIAAGAAGLLLVLGGIAAYAAVTSSSASSTNRARDDDSEEDAPKKKKTRPSASASPEALTVWPFARSAHAAASSSASPVRVKAGSLQPPRSFQPTDVEATLRRTGYSIDNKQSWADKEASGVQLYVSKGRCRGQVDVDHRPGMAVAIATAFNANPGYRSFATEDDVVTIALSSEDRPGPSTFDCTDPLARALAE